MERRKYIYAGLRLSYNGAKRYVYYELIDNDIAAQFTSFSKRLCRMEMIGNVVSAEVTNGGTTFGKADMEPGIGEDHPAHAKITEWSIEARAALIRYDLNRENKKPHPESIEGVVMKLKEHMGVYTRSERARMALYIYNQLVS